MAEEKDDTGIISVRAQKDLIERGKALAKKRGANLSTLLRMLLIKELENDKAAA